jgi:hypothetical protein
MRDDARRLPPVLALVLPLACLFAYQGGLHAARSNLAQLRPGQVRHPTDFFSLWAPAAGLHGAWGAYPDLRATVEPLRSRLGKAEGVTAASVLPVNAYPPLVIAAVWPLSRLSYSTAVDAWVGLNAVILLLTIIMVIRVLWRGAGGVGLGVLGAAFACVFWLGSASMRHDVEAANIGGILAFVVAAAWVSSRGRGTAAAMWSALAAALKLFPALLIVWLFVAGRRRVPAYFAWSIIFLAVALFVCGTSSLRGLAASITVSEQWYPYEYNHSLWGVSYRLFVGSPAGRGGGAAIRPLMVAPAVARGVATASAGLILGSLALVGWRIRHRVDVRAADAYFAATAVAMLLVSPLTWPATLSLLVAPVLILVARWSGRPLVMLGLAVLIGALWIAPAAIEWRFRSVAEAYTPVSALLLLGFKTYALVVLYGFALAAAARQSADRQIDAPYSAP